MPDINGWGQQASLHAPPQPGTPVRQPTLAGVNRSVKTDPVQHLRPHAVEYPVHHFGSVLGRVDMDTERTLPEWRIDDLHHSLAHRRDIRIRWNDSREALHHLFAEVLIRPASYSAIRAWSAGRPECAK